MAEIENTLSGSLVWFHRHGVYLELWRALVSHLQFVFVLSMFLCYWKCEVDLGHAKSRTPLEGGVKVAIHLDMLE
jgi:hypothetical protein